MHHLDAGDRNSRIPKAFEAEHRIDPSFDVAMILLDPSCSSTSTIATSPFVMRH
jgi:16S rRNA C967 or C1407 C5-methylase (RsmB/RsmF family)